MEASTNLEGDGILKYMKKQIFFFILALMGVVVIISNLTEKKAQVPTLGTTETRSLCFIKDNGQQNTLRDRAWLALDITGDTVKGVFKNLPAEKDSKVGTFSGTVGPLDQKSMARTATLWWDSFAEGMNVTEELVVSFGDGVAGVGFGEMIDRGDGVYVYKDKSAVSWMQLNQTDCDRGGEFPDPIVVDAINPSSLVGKKWLWVRTDLPQGKQIGPNPTNKKPFVLEFQSNKTFSSTTDCNSVSGVYSIDGEVLSLGKMVSTLMACPEGTRESDYTTGLSRVASYAIVSDELRLILWKDLGVMIFKKQ